MKNCLARGRSALTCIEIVEGDIEIAILNCGSRQKSKTNLAIVSSIIDNAYTEIYVARKNALANARSAARRSGASSVRAKQLSVKALYGVLAKAETLKTKICNDESFQQLVNDSY